ncbi:YdaU family protein [Bartonella sp. 220]|uniref:hypothetical protein n=1 Tax=Bartonella sp. 220B TaxID=2967260 RepID=UPI0022A95356|nr:hypothetical protein [Bartonella sp. 220B]MCZ2158840.1 YdaU family protein [Bartonella sp. 220B]
MSSKIPWTRLFADKWILDLTCLSSIEGNIYMRLRLQMLHTGEPLLNSIKVWANYTGYSVKAFVKALDVLQSTGHIIRLEDGRLWNLDVEAELNDSVGKSEAASKAVSARWKKSKEKDVKCNTESIQTKYGSNTDSIRTEYESDTQSIPYNNNINSYNKKTNTIVLAKKEIDFEDLETNEQVDKPPEVAAVENLEDQIATVSENQPPIHEQENVSKKAKRSRSNRGCRLPDDFEPDYDFAIAEGLPPERVKVEMAKFRDYWKAKTGKDATKIDWQATWRNWIRNSKDHKINQIGGNYGNHSQRQKSVGERIADSILDIGNRGYFEAHSRDDSPGISFGFEGWQSVNETAGSDCLRCL